MYTHIEVNSKRFFIDTSVLTTSATISLFNFQKIVKNTKTIVSIIILNSVMSNVKFLIDLTKTIAAVKENFRKEELF